MDDASLRWLLRASPAALSWWTGTLGGGALLVVAVRHSGDGLLAAAGPALWMTAALVLVLDLRPVVASGRHDPEGVSLSSAFVFALLFLWGLWPAVLAQSLATVADQVRKRKAPWKLAFNVGQLNLALAAAWLVMTAAGVTPTLEDPRRALEAADIPWVLGAWVAYFLVNDALVAGLLSTVRGFWTVLTEDPRYYLGTTFAVLALSPLVVVLVVNAWALLPVVLVPLALVHTTARMSLAQEHRAAHDDLTGLLNRAGFADALGSALETSRTSGAPCALMLLDLDRFKEVNDTLGHPVGDRLLAAFADRLRGAVRASDTVARLGGDEFAVILPGADLGEARGVADRVAASLAPPAAVDGHRLQLAASIGLCVHPEQARDAETLLQLADVAMYVAKDGGTGIAVYCAEDDRFAQDRRRARGLVAAG